MQYRNDNILLMTAIGDAVGAGVEYVKAHQYPDLIAQARRLEGYVQHPRHKDIAPGDTTDDTHRAWSNASVAIKFAGRLDLITADTFTDSYIRDFFERPAVGWGGAYHDIMDKKVRSVRDFKTHLKSDSSKNGACMGAGVLGVIRDPKECLRIARLQALPTHNSPIGIFAAQAVALMSHFFHHVDRPVNKAELGAFLNRHLGREIASLLPHMALPRTTLVEQPATHTVHAVFDLVTTSSSLTHLLRRGIDMGGDVDSVLTIAMGIASARVENDVPEQLIHLLGQRNQNTPQKLLTLGSELMKAYA